MVHEVLLFIERVGVPAAIALLMLWRLESRLELLTKAVIDLPGRLNGGCPLKKYSSTLGGTPDA